MCKMQRRVIMCLIYTGEDSQKRRKKPHECLTWICNELIALGAFQVSVSDRMRSSSKFTLPGKVQNKGSKAIDLFPLFFRALCSSCLLPSCEITEFPCPADSGILEETTWIKNEGKGYICPVNGVVFPVWSSKAATTCSHLLCSV